MHASQQCTCQNDNEAGWKIFLINSGSMTAAEFMLRLQVDECHNKSLFDCGLQIKHLNLNWNYSNK